MSHPRAGAGNKVILLGNLVRDPEVRTTQDGTKIVNFTLATSERWRDKGSGEQCERTEWHRLVIFNENLARIAAQYLRKGSSVYVEGQLQTRKRTDQGGQLGRAHVRTPVTNAPLVCSLLLEKNKKTNHRTTAT